MATVTKLTYDDLAAMPEDRNRYEIIDGELFVTPSPNLKHQIVIGNLFFALKAFVREHKLGLVLFAPMDVVLTIHNVVEPDVLFVSNSRTGRLTANNIQGAPDLVVEVLSESSRKTDEITKRHLYERYGVTEYWVVDPEIDVVKVYRGGTRVAELSLEQNDVLTTPLLPGLEIPLATIFVS